MAAAISIPVRNHRFLLIVSTFFYYYSFSSSSLANVFIVAWETCGGKGVGDHGTNTNGHSSNIFYCPDGNTCCPGRIHHHYGCIPNDMGSSNATCCLDDDDEMSGCPAGYSCRSSSSSSSSSSHHHIRRGSRPTALQVLPIIRRDCVATEDAPMSDDLVRILPRYTLCHIPNESYTQLHGFDVIVEDTGHVNNANVYAKEIANIHDTDTDTDTGTDTNSDNENNANTITIRKKLAYYSSHGSIPENSSQIDIGINTDIDMVLIVIHGSGRNADDYFCSALAAVDTQSVWNKDKIWVIAPKFFDDSDQDRPTNSEFMYWDHNDGDGAWRYGADDSSSPSSSSRNSDGHSRNGISSFTAVDQLVDRLWSMLPNLRQMVIVGHSSGGQFVNRWSLLTQSWSNRHDKMKAIVANPSSFIYLTPLRWIGVDTMMRGDEKESEQVLLLEQWKIPSAETLINCPNYNQWEWGLDDGGMFSNVPYRNEALKDENSTTAIIVEFQRKRVIYLAGSLDQCSGKDDMPYCHSHGIETTCMDELQGSNRFERSLRYMRSLEKVQVQMQIASPGGNDWRQETSREEYGWENHTHSIISGVGHDHSLMFSKPEGIEAIFGPVRTILDDVYSST